METRGKYILGALTDVFWITDVHSHTLTDRRYSVPAEFSQFSGFNVPEASKHKKHTALEHSTVEMSARKLFELLEKPSMSKRRCSRIRPPIKNLQHLYTHIHHISSARMRKLQLNMPWCILFMVRTTWLASSTHPPVRVLVKPSIIECYKPLNKAIQERRIWSSPFDWLLST